MHGRLKSPSFSVVLACVVWVSACSGKTESVFLGNVTTEQCKQVFTSAKSDWVVTHDLCGARAVWSFQGNTLISQIDEVEPGLLKFLMVEGCSNDNSCSYEVKKADDQTHLVLSYNVNLSSGTLSITLNRDGQLVNLDHSSEDAPS
jgi:hypothetical protein